MNKYGKERISKGLTQEKLAEKLGVTDGTISNWETGRTKISSKNKALLDKVLFDNQESKRPSEVASPMFENIKILQFPAGFSVLKPRASIAWYGDRAYATSEGLNSLPTKEMANFVVILTSRKEKFSTWLNRKIREEINKNG
jgi:transcriptional regulator with XRE-family HTH domain